VLVTTKQMHAILGKARAQTVYILIVRKGCEPVRKQEYIPVINKMGKPSTKLCVMSYMDIDLAIDKLQELIDDPVIDVDNHGCTEMYNERVFKHYRRAIDDLNKIKDVTLGIA